MPHQKLSIKKLAIKVPQLSMGYISKERSDEQSKIKEVWEIGKLAFLGAKLGTNLVGQAVKVARESLESLSNGRRSLRGEAEGGICESIPFLQHTPRHTAARRM